MSHRWCARAYLYGGHRVVRVHLVQLGEPGGRQQIPDRLLREWQPRGVDDLEAHTAKIRTTITPCQNQKSEKRIAAFPKNAIY